ncbi:MAG: T9SS type A sorting domain-containing protein [Lewinellaceae bacterium]|nr:T9SS type A sorting domain-containing protein [Saprospiraceae bacterium]MCB9340957.1 T9SS type A sorting domain-containing protein [Lewinellaceae bacterium]
MKIKIILSVLMWSIYYSIANGQAVLNTTGATVQGSNFFVDYSVGEVSTATVGTPGAMNFSTAGVIQPDTIGVNGVHEYFDSQYYLKVFPNPVSQQLTIETDFSGFHHFQFTNQLGQKAFNGVFDYSPVDLSWMPTGSYFLTLTSDDQNISKTIKIIKQ